MPTYENQSSGPITPIGHKTLQAGERISTVSYLRSLPDGLVLVSHSPRTKPYDLLFSGSPPSAFLECYKYNVLMISNESDGVLTYYANDMSGELMSLAANSTITIETAPSNVREWHTIKAVAAGSGNVKIWGLARSAS